MTASALEPGYFDRLYADNPDPWRFESSEYEHAKYAATIATLPRVGYLSAIEIGCSIGVLTERMAPRCRNLLAVDVAEAPLIRAAARCQHLPQVHFERMTLPGTRPPGQFDLIVLSEVLYYFDDADLTAMANLVASIAAAAADILLVHWLGPTPDYPVTGDAAVTIFERRLGSRAAVLKRERQADYRLDLLRRRDIG